MLQRLLKKAATKLPTRKKSIKQRIILVIDMPEGRSMIEHDAFPERWVGGAANECTDPSMVFKTAETAVAGLLGNIDPKHFKLQQRGFYSTRYAKSRDNHVFHVTSKHAAVLERLPADCHKPLHESSHRQRLVPMFAKVPLMSPNKRRMG